MRPHGVLPTPGVVTGWGWCGGWASGWGWAHCGCPPAAVPLLRLSATRVPGVAGPVKLKVTVW